MDKNDFYKRIKVIAVLSVIPFLVALGPISGYFIGKYFIVKYQWDINSILFFLLVGSLVSVIETIRVIRLALKIEKEA